MTPERGCHDTEQDRGLHSNTGHCHGTGDSWGLSASCWRSQDTSVDSHRNRWGYLVIVIIVIISVVIEHGTDLHIVDSWLDIVHL